MLCCGCGCGCGCFRVARVRNDDVPGRKIELSKCLKGSNYNGQGTTVLAGMARRLVAVAERLSGVAMF